jgi:imidazoleglycerol phosphate dehydratase HisB
MNTDETQLSMITYDLYRKIRNSIANCDGMEYSLLKKFLVNLLMKANLCAGIHVRSYEYVNNWHNLEELRKSVCNAAGDPQLRNLCTDLVDATRNNTDIVQNLMKFIYSQY